jgi:hypothetical protein
MIIPEAVFSSAAAGFTKILSAEGLKAIADILFVV